MKKLYEQISKIVEKISVAGLILSAATLFLVVAMIFIDVILRKLFSSPFSGQQELAELGTVLVVYFGLPYATRIRSHVRVEPITGMFPAAARSILYGVLDFIIVVFMAVLTWKVFQQAGVLVQTPTNATLILRIPYFYIYYAAAIGAAVSTLEFLLDGVRYIMEGVEAAKGRLSEEGGAQS